MRFFAASDVTIIGYNPEMADFDHPRGERFGYAAYVYAEDDLGNRRRKWVSTGYQDSAVIERAERVAKALQTRFDDLGKPPVAFQAWEEARPAYGSPAYDPLDEIALERLEEEHNAY